MSRSQASFPLHVSVGCPLPTWPLAICVETTVWLRTGHSPAEEPGHHGCPGDAAGVGLLGLHCVVPPAAARTHQVNSEEDEVQAQANGSYHPQEEQRLKEREGPCQLLVQQQSLLHPHAQPSK